MKYCNGLLPVLLSVFLAALFVGRTNAEEPPTSRVGLKVAEFKLKDFRGHTHQLSDFDDQQAVVLAVLGTECPLAKLYGVRLAELHEKYKSKGVAFIGLNANVQDSITEIAAFARIHKIEFPLLKDLGNEVADQIKAVRTPEVFLLDKDRVVRYWGRIDDQYGVGYIRNEPTRNDLALAIDQLLAGQEITTPETVPVGCHIGRVQVPKKNAKITFSNQIAAILQKRCMECHREGEIAPFALANYDEVVGWAEMIREVLEENRMPPWHADPNHGSFSNDRSMPAHEKQLIYQWVADGAPLGDLKEVPAPPKFVEGWQLPREPDEILDIQEEPFRVKAEGEVKYVWFEQDLNLTEDKWLRAAEILPGNRAVVHHILAFTRKKGDRSRLGEGDGFLAAFVPGLRPRPYPEGMAKRIPKGSQLVFQVHYTTIGSVQFDQSKIGLVYADPDEVTHEIRTTRASARGRALKIPPHAKNHQVDAYSMRAPSDLLLLAMMPHMHLRGKSFRYVAVDPGGKRDTLLDIPAYDFNWQTAYRLSEPLELKKGTRIHCIAHYDNSEKNLNNPDPSVTVGWGDQTWDEMMIGYFDIAWPLNARETSTEEPDVSAAQQEAAALIARLDQNDDGKLTLSETPRNAHRLFRLIDVNKDEVVTLEELTSGLEKRRR